MRYILYVRKSTDREDKQVQSVPDQIEVLTKLAKERGYNIVEMVVETKSAKNPGRPLFNKMLDDIESGKADAILCWKIDRLNRNPIDGGRIQWMLQQGKLKMIQTYDRSYYPEDNIIILSVESAMANQYIIELRKNTMRGMSKKLNEGWLPSRMPVGYINDPDNRTNVPDPERFHIVRKIWDYVLMGCYSVPQILDIATNDWGLNQRATRKYPIRTLKISGLYKILRNTFYAGYFKFDGQRYEGSHKPMVTLTEFQRVQEILDGKEVNSGPIKHHHAYTGFMRCAECGYHVTCDVKRKYNKATDTTKIYRYYRCTGRGPACSQVGRMVRVEDLEAQFDEYLASVQVRPELKEWGLTRVKEKFKESSQQFVGRLGVLDARITTLIQNKDHLLKLLIDETISKSEYEHQKQEIEGELIKAKAQRESLMVSNVQWVKKIEESFDFISSARDHFLKGDVFKKREIAKAIGQNFFMKDKKLIVEPHPWLVPIIENKDMVCLPYDRLEPLKNLSGTALAALGEACVCPWGPHGESNSGLLDENQLSGPLDDGASNKLTGREDRTRTCNPALPKRVR